MHYVETLSFTGWAELSQEISTWSSFDRHLLTQQIDANLTSENVDKQLQFTQREGCHFMSYRTKNVKLIEIRILNQVVRLTFWEVPFWWIAKIYMKLKMSEINYDRNTFLDLEQNIFDIKNQFFDLDHKAGEK